MKQEKNGEKTAKKRKLIYRQRTHKQKMYCRFFFLQQNNKVAKEEENDQKLTKYQIKQQLTDINRSKCCCFSFAIC